MIGRERDRDAMVYWNGSNGSNGSNLANVFSPLFYVGEMAGGSPP